MLENRNVIAQVLQNSIVNIKENAATMRKKVLIDRPSIWGNPFIIGRDGDKADRLRKYRDWIMGQPELLERAKKELRGRTIACWCKPEACHGDILATCTT